MTDFQCTEGSCVNQWFLLVLCWRNKVLYRASCGILAYRGGKKQHTDVPRTTALCLGRSCCIKHKFFLKLMVLLLHRVGECSMVNSWIIFQRDTNQFFFLFETVFSNTKKHWTFHNHSLCLDGWGKIYCLMYCLFVPCRQTKLEMLITWTTSWRVLLYSIWFL